MKISVWLRNTLFGIPPEERFCYNCQFFDKKHFESLMESEHEIFRHHLEIGGWHPKGKRHGSGDLGWCEKKNIATVRTAISCDNWKELT